MELSNQKQIMGLMNEALIAINCMGDRYQPKLAPVFLRARNNLELPINRRDHKVLMLSATQRCIEEAEKQTVAVIIGDDWVRSEQLSHFVRVRMICLKLKEKLSESMLATKKSDH
jgi:hypothetical protein